MRTSYEMFCLDADGRKQDADLHEAILGEDKPDNTAIRAEMLAAGWSQERIDRLWSPPSRTAVTPREGDDGA